MPSWRSVGDPDPSSGRPIGRQGQGHGQGHGGGRLASLSPFIVFSFLDFDIIFIVALPVTIAAALTLDPQPNVVHNDDNNYD